MSRDGTLGSLLQGVSQQPAAVRPDGKVTEQINFVSDVVQGLTSRPALFEKGLVTSNPNSDFKWTDVLVEGERYILGYRPGIVFLWDTAGQSMDLAVQDSGVFDYIGPNMQSYVFEDIVYLANRDLTVATESAPDTSSVYGFNNGIVYCLGGIYSRTYAITVTYPNGDFFTAEYTTPDGTTSGDAEKTSAEYIIEQLEIALNAASPGFAATGSVARSGKTLHFFDFAEDFALAVSDGEDGSSLRAFVERVDGLDDLSETAPHGMLVRVTNDDEGAEDDFYMRFNSDVTDVLGDGFGSDGVWQEWYNVDEIANLDLTTMPHVLRKTGPTQFTLERGSWFSRRVGDEETNPFPDFIGYPIRDIGGFQSRLVMVAGPSVCMSRTNEPLDFFKKSALTDLSTDPINITSTQEGTTSLDWIIAFDRDLVLMTDPGDGQFLITGSTTITPQTASLVKTTSFEMRGGAKPVETGRTILFPFKSGNYSGIKEFFTNDEVATNGADTITETADRYIPGLVTHMACSTNFNMAVFKTDDPGHTNTVWVYKFLWQSVDKLQSAWSKWTFPEEVRYFFFDGSELYVVMQEEDGLGEYNFIFNALDLDIPVNVDAGYHVCLDRQQTVLANVSSEVVLPFENASFVQGPGCADPGRQVTHQTYVAGTYTFDPVTVPSGATVYAGLKYTRSVKPTMPFVRGRDGRPLPRTHLVVGSFLLEYEDTGYIKSIMSSRYRQDDVEFIMDWFPIDNDPADPMGNGLRSGILNIPWGERSDWSEMTIMSDDVRPTTILEIEWTGQVFKGSRG